MIYGFSVQKIGHVFEGRCLDCMRLRAYRFPVVRDHRPTSTTLRCEVHPKNCDEWRWEAEEEQEKRVLATRIGLI